MLAFCIVIASCSPNCDWAGGEIRDFGTFCNSNFTIRVDEEDQLLKYEVTDSNGRSLIVQDMNISTIQNWGLFLDKKANLWIFSSDVGTSIWERNSDGKYYHRIFYRQATKEDVPPELYESSLRRFLKH